MLRRHAVEDKIKQRGFAQVLSVSREGRKSARSAKGQLECARLGRSRTRLESRSVEAERQLFRRPRMQFSPEQ